MYAVPYTDLIVNLNALLNLASDKQISKASKQIFYILLGAQYNSLEKIA